MNLCFFQTARPNNTLNTPKMATLWTAKNAAWAALRLKCRSPSSEEKVRLQSLERIVSFSFSPELPRHGGNGVRGSLVLVPVSESGLAALIVSMETERLWEGGEGEGEGEGEATRHSGGGLRLGRGRPALRGRRGEEGDGDGAGLGTLRVRAGLRSYSISGNRKGAGAGRGMSVRSGETGLTRCSSMTWRWLRNGVGKACGGRSQYIGK